MPRCRELRVLEIEISPISVRLNPLPGVGVSHRSKASSSAFSSSPKSLRGVIKEQLRQPFCYVFALLRLAAGHVLKHSQVAAWSVGERTISTAA